MFFLRVIEKDVEPVSFEESEKDFVWYDQHLIQSIDQNDEDVDLFFKCLSLCHTVMPEERNGKLIYQAQSPDEFALVSAARSFRYVFQVSIEILLHRHRSTRFLSQYRIERRMRSSFE